MKDVRSRRRLAAPHGQNSTRRTMAESLEPRVLFTTVELLADLNPTDGSSSPAQYADLNGKAVFWNGGSVYASDGSGATLLRAGVLPSGVSPVRFVVAGDAAYFQVASSSAYGAPTSLWRTDGTAAAGTQQVVQLPAFASNFASCDGSLYFSASSSANQLWTSDGTAAGTRLVYTMPAGYAAPSGMTSFGGAVYFASANGSAWSLFRTDGTPAGTTIVKTELSGASSPPYGFTVANGLLYFAAYTNANGR
jgi:ELWxxDGT repeat protein